MSESETKRLTQIVSDTLNAATGYQMSMKDCNKSDTVRLLDSPDAQQDELTSQFILPGAPEFALFSVTKHKQALKIIGQRSRPYILQHSGSTYPVDSDKNAIALLENDRVDGVIDYRANTPIYERRFDNISIQVLRESQPIHIVFESKKRLIQFEQGIELQAQRQIHSPFVKQLRNNNDLTQIDWFVLNKYFSPQQDALIALQEELDAAEWINQRLPTHNLNIVTTNRSYATERLKATDNACLAGVFKTPERETYAFFSQSYFYYLNPRVYALKDSQTHKQLQQHTDSDGVLDAVNAFTSIRQISVGYSPGITRKSNDLTMLMESNADRFISIEAFERERIFALMQKGRIDSMVEFPTNVKQLTRNGLDVSRIASFKFAPARPPMAVYVACSRSELGSALVLELDNLLTSTDTRFEYMRLITKGLTSSAEIDVHKAAGTYDQFLNLQSTE